VLSLRRIGMERFWSDYRYPSLEGHIWGMRDANKLGKYKLCSDWSTSVVTREMLEKAKMPKFKVGDKVLVLPNLRAWLIVHIENDNFVLFNKEYSMVVKEHALEPYIDKHAGALKKIEDIISNGNYVWAAKKILNAFESGKIDYDKK